MTKRTEREIRKELTNIERQIAKLDEQKKASEKALLNEANAQEAMRLHNEVQALIPQLATLEERWVEVSEELENV